MDPNAELRLLYSVVVHGGLSDENMYGTIWALSKNQFLSRYYCNVCFESVLKMREKSLRNVFIEIYKLNLQTVNLLSILCATIFSGRLRTPSMPISSIDSKRSTVGPDIPELTISSSRIRWSTSCFSDIQLNDLATIYR